MARSGGMRWPAEDGSPMSYLFWGALALGAVALAVTSIGFAFIAGRDDGPGVNRVSLQAPPVVRAPNLTELARLNETVRALAADRDQLAGRIEQIERTFGDVTASVSRPSVATTGPASAPALPLTIPLGIPLASAPPAAQPVEPPLVSAPPPAQPIQPVQPAQPAEPPLVSVPPPVQPIQPIQPARPAEPPPARVASDPALDSTLTRTEFAIDLGSAMTLAALRVRWTELSGKHPVLGHLRPLAGVRDGGQAGSVQLRLIAGPFANAADAARMCAVLAAGRIECDLGVFVGQRLAVR